MRLLTKERTRACTAAFKDTGHLSILIDDHEIGEVPGDALRYDPLQGQTSSVVHVGIWDDCGQLLAKPHRPLQDTNQMMWHKSLCVQHFRWKSGQHQEVCQTIINYYDSKSYFSAEIKL